MAQKLRINLTISREVKHDLEKRDNFNASLFFESAYRELFMNKEAIKEKIKYHETELKSLEEKMTNIKSTEVMMPTSSSDRCGICNMYFHEDISIRNKVHVYKSLDVCRECYDSQKNEINKRVAELKADAEE